jgi:hypothetical protein
MAVTAFIAAPAGSGSRAWRNGEALNFPKFTRILAARKIPRRDPEGDVGPSRQLLPICAALQRDDRLRWAPPARGGFVATRGIAAFVSGGLQQVKIDSRIWLQSALAAHIFDIAISPK